MTDNIKQQDHDKSGSFGFISGNRADADYQAAKKATIEVADEYYMKR